MIDYPGIGLLEIRLNCGKDSKFEDITEIVFDDNLHEVKVKSYTYTIRFKLETQDYDKLNKEAQHGPPNNLILYVD